METKKKFSSPTALAVSPPKLIFHRRIARGAFGVVYLVSDDSGTQFAVKRTKKFGKKRSRELVNLGICKGARNVVKYFGSFYTIDPCGNFIQNLVLEHLPYNFRAYLRMIKCEMNKNFASINHTDYQIQSQTNYQTTYQNIIRYTFSDCPYPINPTLYTNPNNQANTIIQLSCLNQPGTNNQLSGVNPGLGVYSDLCNKLIYILRNVGIGIKEIHDRGLIHRDLKPDNILIDHVINPQEIRICDLGSAKRNNTLVNDKYHKKSTPYICSRWYRAPELLFGSTHYGEQIDAWCMCKYEFTHYLSAFGCICAEVLLLKPLFIPLVNCDSQQVLRILDILGSPSRYELEKMLKTVPREGIKEKARELFKIYESNKKLDIIVDNLSKGNSKLEAIGLVAKSLLRWCPKDRISMSEALEILNNC